MKASGDTIFALSSGQGRAAIALIRISGPDARAALRLCPGPELREREASLRLLRDPRDGEPIDQAIVLRFAAGASSTGEDVIEFHCHGGAAVIARVLQALASLPGYRMAEAGEFSRRAFANGRQDLTEIEGVADLIDAETEAQRRQALRQATGALSRHLTEWRAQAIAIMARLEAAIDFADEELPAGLLAWVAGEADSLAESLRRAVASAERGERVRRGLDVVLLGPPNVGKSSILNWSAGREAAIVTELPGTTRDIVEVSLVLGGLPVTVADTAGLRPSEDRIEVEGMRRARDRAASADLILEIRDATRPEETVSANIAEGHVVVWNKWDIGQPQHGGFPVSALTGENMERLAELIASRAAALTQGEPALVTRERQRVALAKAAERWKAVAGGAEIGLMAEEARTGLAWLERVVGRIDIEDILHEIFSSFCIGK